MKKENLTWEDIRQIVNIADYFIKESLEGDMPEYLETEEKYYRKILETFNSIKRSGTIFVDTLRKH